MSQAADRPAGAISPPISPETRRVIAAARAGEAAAVAQVRRWLGPLALDPPQVFAVASNRVIRATRAGRPRQRREVFQAFSPFVAGYTLYQRADEVNEAAIEQVRACAPLARVFQSAALAQLGKLQTQLVMDTLGRAGRGRIRRQLEQLMRPGRPIWEHWVRLTPAHQHKQFDRLVANWLDAPVDLRESKWFEPGWKDRPYDVEWAADLLAGLPAQLRAFLDVELCQCRCAGHLGPCAVLRASLDDANRWCTLVGARLVLQAQ